MDEPNHIWSQVSFFVMKILYIQAPIIWQNFPFKKYRINKRSARAKVTLDLRLASNVGISDHWGKPKIVSEYDQEIPQSQTADNP